MSSGPTAVDPAVLRTLLRRLSDLEEDANGVTDTILSHLPVTDPGLAVGTVGEVGAAIVDAFSHLADSVAQTRFGVLASQAAGDARVGTVGRVIDLTDERIVDLTRVRDIDEMAR